MFDLKQQFNDRSGRLTIGFICAAFAMAMAAQAQSTRPGWGATPYHDLQGTGVTFRVWAPNATSVTLPGSFNGWNNTFTPTNHLTQELTNNVGDGIWSLDLAGITNGSQYKFYFNGNLWKQDPRARLVNYSGSGGNSIVYDPNAFNWAGDNFTNPPLSDLFVYELHIGTFPSSSVPSRFIAAISKLDYLKSLGVNVVELMPVAEFPTDASWGYNPAQPFAVENIGYGGPDGLKAFVQACHQRGLAVFLDTVQNHYGPDDLDMWNFDGFAGNNALGGGGIYFYQSNTNLQKTSYGATRPNFNDQQVDNYVTDNIYMWLNECHLDGFRWDTPYVMTHGYDGTYIPAAGNLVNAINTMIHTNAGKISISEDVYNFWGFDSAWDTGYPYTVTPVLTNTVDSSRNMITIANAVQYNVNYGGSASSARVAYLESHDVVGDLNGPHNVRLVTAIDTNAPNSYRARKLSTLGATVTLTAPGIPMIFQGQEMLENQQFDSSRLVDWSKTNTYSRIVQLYRDLIGARRDLKGYTPGLEGNQFGMLKVDNNSKLISFHRWKSGTTNQDAMVIANFGNTNYPVYNLNFPSAGTWYVHFNTDSTDYSSDFGNNGGAPVIVGGNLQGSVAIGPYSALILSQTPDAPPQLTMTQVNGMVNVSWPNTYSEWVLDTCQALSGNSTSWSQVPADQYQNDGNNIFISVPAPSGPTFYRLRKS